MYIEPEAPTKPPVFIAVFAGITLLFWLFAAVPIFSMAFRYQFLPSPSYITESSYYSVLLGIINGFAALGMMASGKRDLKEHSALLYFAAYIFASVFSFIAGETFVTCVFPMGTALLVGSPTEIVYVVEDPFFPGSKYCRGR